MVRSLLLFCALLLFSWPAVRPTSAAHPRSPCPEVFNYEGSEPENNRWYGQVWLKAAESLVGIRLDVEFDRFTDLMVSWMGEVTTDDNMRYIVLNLNQRLKAGVPVLSRIMVKFDRSKGSPEIKSIRLNGRKICPKNSAHGPGEISGPQIPQNAGRPNPVFAVNNFGGNANPMYVNKPKPTAQSTDNISKPNLPSDNIAKPSTQSTNVHKPNAQSTNNNRPNVGNPPKHRPQTTTEEPFTTRKIYKITTPASPDWATAPDNNPPNTVPLQSPESNGDIIALISEYLENEKKNNASTSATSIGGSQESFSEEVNRPNTNGGTTPKTTNNFGELESNTNNRPSGQQSSWSRPNTDQVSGNSFTSNSDAQDELSEECGRVRTTTPLVTHGMSTRRGQWPWHVALYVTRELNLYYNCGGTLVSKNKVVTAAHCVMDSYREDVIDSTQLVIHLGKSHQVQNSEEKGVQTRSVSRISVYSEYNKFYFFGDIAVLTLSSEVAYTPYVGPVCLWDKHSTDSSEVVGKDGTVVGWGWDENNKMTVQLKMAHMPVVSRETCLESNPKIFSLYTSDKTLCAGYKNGTSACNGDSGGGMVFRKDSRWYLRGIVSNAVAEEETGGCDTKQYVVFTDVAKYLDFIYANL